MGGKCIKDIKVVNVQQASKSTSNKSQDNISHHSSSSGKKLEKSNELRKGDLKSELTNKQFLKNDNLRKNSKKGKVVQDIPSSKEKDVLKIIKKHNRDLDDAELIDNSLKQHFFTQVLDKQSRKEIIKEMTLCLVQSGEPVFCQGTLGSFFYIVKKGQLDLHINNQFIKDLKDGDSFGELALLHGAPRSGTIKAVTDTYLWVLERKNFRKIINHINYINFEENKKFVDSIPILANIENDQKSLLCSNLIKGIYSPGMPIVKEGEIASCLYIIKEGEVDCVHHQKVIRTLYKGEHFGEKSILLDSNRTMDVIAKTNCICYSISVETLKSMVGVKYRDVLYLNFIKSSFVFSHCFSKFNPKLLESSYEYFQAYNFSKNDVVFKVGHCASSKLIVVLEGNLVNNKTRKIAGKRGSILFEKELVENSPEKIDYDLVADPDCLLVAAETSNIIKHLNGSFKELLGKSSIIDTLKKVHIFKNFTHQKLEILSQKIGTQTFENGKKIINQGEEGKKFYLVRKGKIDIYVNNNYIRSLTENQYLGERALFFKESRSATAVANGSIELFYLDKEDFLNCIESNMKSFLMNRLYLQDNTLELKDLDFIQQLGSGNYGQVSLVQSRKNKFLYAIKGIAKKQIDHEQLHQNLELERSILLQIDHPFIVKLVKTLKDTRHIYFLMEYIKGRELFDVIRDIGLLNKYQTEFYGASLMLAVEYLHQRKFIYRDIKPENVIVIDSGYIKLIDFGTAKDITDRTSTIIGTPHYMAPEVILGEGYSFQIDFWSAAVCMFEFMCGAVPFGESAEDPMDVYLAIINDKMEFPTFCKDKEFKHLMTSMLCKSPLNRLFKLSQIKNHIWFKDFDWDNLISLNAEPAFFPKVEKEDSIKALTPFCTYAQNNIKEWVPPKDSHVDTKNQAEFDKWFKGF